MRVEKGDSFRQRFHLHIRFRHQTTSQRQGIRGGAQPKDGHRYLYQTIPRGRRGGVSIKELICREKSVPVP